MEVNEQSITEAAQSVRSAILAVNGSTEYHCFVAVRLLADCFGQKSVKRVQARYLGDSHEIAQIGRWFVDVTADQFGGEEILITVELPEEYDAPTPMPWVKSYGLGDDALCACRAAMV